MKNLKILLITLSFAFTGTITAQNYVLSESLNQDDMTPTSFRDTFFTIDDDADLSEWHDLPFTWNFYGTPVDQFRISENGYVVFNPSAETESNGSNTNLSDPSAPDNAIFAFWEDFDWNWLISTWLEGTGNNRVYTIYWGSSEVADVPGNFSFELRLYENCGDFDVVLGKYDASSIETDLSGTVGCKKNDERFTQAAASPNHLGDIYEQVYSFHYEEAIVRDIALINVDLNNHLSIGSHSMEMMVRNKGNMAVNSFDLIYTVDEGAEQIHSVSDIAIEEDNGTFTFIHDIH
jgi:hypothetical protein